MPNRCLFTLIAKDKDICRMFSAVTFKNISLQVSEQIVIISVVLI
jgi:hypothetical protein